MASPGRRARRGRPGLPLAHKRALQKRACVPPPASNSLGTPCLAQTISAAALINGRPLRHLALRPKIVRVKSRPPRARTYAKSQIKYTVPMSIKFIFLLIISHTLLSYAEAEENTLTLGGEKSGCPMKIVYSPALLTINPKVAIDFAKHALDDFAANNDFMGITGIGIYKDPSTNRIWRLLSTLGPSCDPSFIAISSGPSGAEIKYLSGETMRLISSSKFTITKKSNLYFEIQRRFKWKNGQPIEIVPDFYKVEFKTKTRSKVPLFPDKASTSPVGEIPAHTQLQVLGYSPTQSNHRALVHYRKGENGWVELVEGLFEGISYHGD